MMMIFASACALLMLASVVVSSLSGCGGKTETFTPPPDESTIQTVGEEGLVGSGAGGTGGAGAASGGTNAPPLKVK